MFRVDFKLALGFCALFLIIQHGSARGHREGVISPENTLRAVVVREQPILNINPLPAGTTISVESGVSAVIVVPKGLIPGIDPDMPFVLRVYRTQPDTEMFTIRDRENTAPIPLPSVMIPIRRGTTQIVVFPDGTVKQNAAFQATRIRVDGAVVGIGNLIVTEARPTRLIVKAADAEKQADADV